MKDPILVIMAAGMGSRYGGLKQIDPVNKEKAEYFIPNVVGNLLADNKAEVKVLPSKDKWYGVTYKKDKETVEKAIQSFKEQGIFPDRLWNTTESFDKEYQQEVSQ